MIVQSKTPMNKKIKFFGASNFHTCREKTSKENKDM